MSLLANWISQLIVLVLIMMIVLMLLPDRHMKKYAQFSLSLIFVLFFIQPILSIFNIDISQQSDQLMDQLFNDPDTSTMNKDINIQKKEIQASSHAYVIEELANQLKQEVEEEFNHTFNYRITHLEVDTPYSENEDLSVEPAIEDITVHIHLDKAGETIGYVSPIIIDTEQEVNRTDVEFEQDHPVLLSWLSNRLDINQTQIKLYWEGG
ncbi:stage III sporulation protein AF [Amphibacillus sediminis]|uniref:stage III sporulation protein AF n=1 Tax=Amphibacillus sediminis TaxID=360185 RepID=UPI0008373E65|nr:stage III sporulation protein AF [Amphibacillus sediminis]